MEEAPGFEPGIRVLQTRALPLGYASMKQSLITFQWSGRRDSNPRPQPWQGCALPAELRPQSNGWAGRDRTYASRSQSPLPYRLATAHRMGRLVGIEPTNAGATIRCVNHFAIAAILILLVEGDGFEPPNPEGTDLQSAAFGQLRYPSILF